MPNYSKGVSEIVKALSKKAKMAADFSANPKSFYSKLPVEHQQAYIDDVLYSMAIKNPNKSFDEAEFLSKLRNRMIAEQQASKAQKAFEANQPVKEPDLHARNFELERQADDFLRENDPEFFEELNNAMKNYDENIENVDDYSKIPALMEQELDYIPEEKPLNYHLSKDPLENASEINFPDTTLNKRYHNVAMPRGKYYFEGQHKPADYYHNILWNYINKGENKDALLNEFFKDIVKKNIDNKVDKQFYLRKWLRPAEKDRLYKQAFKNKYQTIKKYKDVLDKRRFELDMKNKPYNKHKLNNMKLIEEYFDNLRPSSFEDFESKTLSPSRTEQTTLERIVHPEYYRLPKK